MRRVLALLCGLLCCMPVFATFYNGLYLGGSYLYRTGQLNPEYSRSALGSLTSDNVAESSSSQASGGSLFLGYGQMLSKHFYLGGEVAGTGFSQGEKKRDKHNIQQTYPIGSLDFSSITGYKLNEKIMLFLRFGLGASWYNERLENIQVSVPQGKSLAGETRTTSDDPTGILNIEGGLGADYMITQHIMARAEYDYVASPRQELATTVTANGLAVLSREQESFQPGYNQFAFSLAWVF